MIYAPRAVYDLRLALASGVVAALEAAAIDFVAQDNKPWTYYLGVGFGGAAAATGIQGAAATLYAIGETFDAALFHSPNGSDVDVFLDGILSQSFSTYSGTSGWVGHALAMAPNIQHRIDIVNGSPASGNTSGISWLSIDLTEIVNGTANGAGQNGMALTTYSYRVLDADGNSKSVLVQAPYVAQTLANLVTAAQAIATDIDAVIDGQITEININVASALPGGIKSAPVADCDVEHGGLLTFNATGTAYVWSMFLPTIKDSVLAADAIPNTGAVATLTGDMIAGIGSSGAQVAFSDRYGFDLASFKVGKETFRK